MGSNPNWLKDIETGDQVFVCNSQTKKLCTVTWTTKTMIVVSDSRFSRKTGHKIGGSIGYSSILEQATEDEIKKFHAIIIKKRAAKKLAEIDWLKFDTDFLNEIIAYISDKEVN